MNPSHTARQGTRWMGGGGRSGSEEGEDPATMKKKHASLTGVV